MADDVPSVRLNVKVVPGASRNRVAGRYGEGLKVQVSAPPEKGRANEAVIKVLAEFLGVRAEQIQITGGQTQQRKTVRISGIDQPAIDSRLAELP